MHDLSFRVCYQLNWFNCQQQRGYIMFMHVSHACHVCTWLILQAVSAFLCVTNYPVLTCRNYTPAKSALWWKLWYLRGLLVICGSSPRCRAVCDCGIFWSYSLTFLWTQSRLAIFSCRVTNEMNRFCQKLNKWYFRQFKLPFACMILICVLVHNSHDILLIY